MMFESADWYLSVFLFISLVIVRGFEKQIKTVSARSYDNIARGLVVLAITVVARLYHATGLLESVPFLSETVFFDLAYWIGIITGATFVVSGVSEWVPLARDYRSHHGSSIEHLTMLRKVEQLVGVESRIETILSTTLQYMSEQMPFTAGAVFKCSYSRRLLNLESTTGEFDVDPQTLNGVELDPDAIWSRRQEIAPSPSNMLSHIPAGIGRPLATLPIIVHRQPVGFFVLWGDLAEDIDPDDMLTLRLVTDVIARKVERDRLTLQHRTENRDLAWRTRLEQTITKSDDTRQRFTALARGLQGQLPLDQVSLTVIDRNGKVAKTAKRYTCGTAGRILVESGVAWPPSGGLITGAIETGQVTTYHDLDNQLELGATEMTSGQAARSLMIAPFSQRGELTSVLMLTSQSRAIFSPRIQRQIKTLNAILESVIWPDMENGFRRAENRRLERLRSITSATRDETRQAEVLEQAALAISDEIDADLVRVSVLDQTGSFLESKALIASGSHDEIVPANGQMILSLMPLHEQVMNSGQPVALDESTVATAMPDIERRQALTDTVRSVLLVPLMHAGEVIGIISIGSLSSDSLTPTRHTFVRTVADLLASNLDTSTKEAEADRDRLPESIDRRAHPRVRTLSSGYMEPTPEIDRALSDR